MLRVAAQLVRRMRPHNPDGGPLRADAHAPPSNATLPWHSFDLRPLSQTVYRTSTIDGGRLRLNLP
jgi:hypothetical protein